MVSCSLIRDPAALALVPTQFASRVMSSVLHHARYDAPCKVILTMQGMIRRTTREAQSHSAMASRVLASVCLHGSWKRAMLMSWHA
eukprot:366264-Chlamydomonas_euryale.AAC.8